MARTVDGGRAVECTTLESAREPKLHGRSAIRNMTSTLLRDLETDRDNGRHNMTSDQMRLAAERKARALVDEQVAAHGHTPLR